MSTFKRCFILTLFFSTNAFPSDNLSGDLMSLNYYPHLHRVEFNPRVTMTLISHDSTNTGAEVADTHNTVQAYVGYGFAHRWRVSILETFLWDGSTTTTAASGAQSDSNSQGLSNPTITAAWRFMEVTEGGISGDIAMAASPSLGPKVQGDSPSGRDGNNLNGYWSNSIAASLFWRNDFNEAGLALTATQTTKGVTDTANNGPLHIDPFTVFTATLSDRIHFGQNYFIEPSGILTLPYSYGQIGDDQVARTMLSPISIDPGLRFGFRPDPNIALFLYFQYHSGTTTLRGDLSQAEVNTTATVLTSTLSIRHQF